MAMRAADPHRCGIVPATGHHRLLAAEGVRPRRRAAAVIVVALAGLLLAGCAGSDSTGSAPVDVGASVAAPEAAAPDGRASGADAVAGEGAPAGGTVVAADRDLIETVSLSLRTPDVLGTTARLLQVATGYRALVVDQSTSSGIDPGPVPACDTVNEGCRAAPVGYAVSTVTLRVEPERVDALLADVAALGTQISVSRQVADVTAQVADIDARVRTAQASVARVRALMTRAETIADLVALEAELSTRQAELESMQAQQRALADQTALATVTVTLVDEGVTVTEPEEDRGFLAGLRAGWSAFTEASIVGMTILGAVLPFLVVLGLLVLLIVLIVRLAQRRRPVAGAVPGPADARPADARPADPAQASRTGQ